MRINVPQEGEGEKENANGEEGVRGNRCERKVRCEMRDERRGEIRHVGAACAGMAESRRDREEI